RREKLAVVSAAVRRPVAAWGQPDWSAATSLVCDWSWLYDGGVVQIYRDGGEGQRPMAASAGGGVRRRQRLQERQRYKSMMVEVRWLQE
ncbi:hypothetical protein SESBI_37524, partial [Sesbania bispinosa]